MNTNLPVATSNVYERLFSTTSILVTVRRKEILLTDVEHPLFWYATCEYWGTDNLKKIAE